MRNLVETAGSKTSSVTYPTRPGFLYGMPGLTRSRETRMSCTPTHTPSELEFVQSLITRPRAIGQCRGPLLRIAFGPYRVFVLEHLLDSKVASELLWDGFCADSQVGVLFELCGAHWMDLASLCQLRADQYRRSDWAAQGEQLLLDVCRTAGWDEKEILNMILWQRERLT